MIATIDSLVKHGGLCAVYNPYAPPIFVHENQVREQRLRVGLRLRFDVTRNESGPQALNVEVLSDEEDVCAS